MRSRTLSSSGPWGRRCARWCGRWPLPAPMAGRGRGPAAPVLLQSAASLLNGLAKHCHLKPLEPARPGQLRPAVECTGCRASGLLGAALRQPQLQELPAGAGLFWASELAGDARCFAALRKAHHSRGKPRWRARAGICELDRHLELDWNWNLQLAEVSDAPNVIARWPPRRLLFTSRGEAILPTDAEERQRLGRALGASDRRLRRPASRRA